MSKPPLIIHLHGFKCGGTTVAGILEKNYPNQVLYVESLLANERLNFDRVLPLTLNRSYKAITSHLLAVPQTSNDLVITLLRNPKERLISAYQFQKATNTLKPGDNDFRSFLNRLRNSSVANYQSRLLSKQSWSSPGIRNGWDLDPWSIDINKSNFFVGTVELFDESMVLLEMWLARHGIEFDASYQSVANKRERSLEDESDSQNQSDLIYKEMIEIDELLWIKATARIKNLMSEAADFDTLLQDYKLRSAKELNPLRIVGPNDFIRL